MYLKTFCALFMGGVAHVFFVRHYEYSIRIVGNVFGSYNYFD